MNRRMRNRMSGGVGGREPRGSLLPDFTPYNMTNVRSSEARKLAVII